MYVEIKINRVLNITKRFSQLSHLETCQYCLLYLFNVNLTVYDIIFLFIFFIINRESYLDPIGNRPTDILIFISIDRYN